MKEELDTILRYLDHDDEEILKLRDSILDLDILQHEEIENLIEYLNNSIAQVNFESHDYLGYYSFFLGCAYYEKGEYVIVIESLESTISQLWEAQINKSLAYWLLGISYSNLNAYSKARGALQEALNILSTNRNTNAQSAQKQYQQRSPIRERINKTLTNLQIGTLNLQEISTEIISQLQIPEGEFNLYWREWQESICAMQSNSPFHISEQIDLLMHIKPDMLMGISFINIFLAHCYNLDFFSGNKQSLSSAIKYAEDAVIEFSGNELNQALAHWYVALLYFNLSNTETCQSHLEASDYLLSPILETTKHTSSNFYKDMRNTRNDLWDLINKFNQTNRLAYYVTPTNLPEPKERSSIWGRKKENKEQVESAFAPKLTVNSLVSKNKQPPKTSSKSVYDPELTKGNLVQHPKTSSNSTLENRSNIRHIIVPVDISALDDQQLKAIPLNHDLFDKLESYNHLDIASQKTVLHPLEVPAEKRIVIPCASIYGQVSAGPNGEALLSSSEILGQSDEVYEDMRVQIEGREHEIKFIIFPIPTFLKSKVYGWLKVTGNSMNKALPQSILPNDYVLFCENHNFESCIRKIVIAMVSELEGYPPRTMIKRLIKMTGETTHQEDGYASELHKFMLHSESSSERDPVNGMSFKKDIEIEREYQIAGEVIAIAKPV